MRPSDRSRASQLLYSMLARCFSCCSSRAHANCEPPRPCGAQEQGNRRIRTAGRDARRGGTLIPHGGAHCIRRRRNWRRPRMQRRDTVQSVALANTDPPFFIDIRLHPPVSRSSSCWRSFQRSSPARFRHFNRHARISMKCSGRERGSSSLKIGRMSRALVVFEIALGCGLLVASEAMIKSVTKLNTMDPGFRTPSGPRVGSQRRTPTRCRRSCSLVQLRQDLAALPGVRAAAITSRSPGNGWLERRTRDDRARRTRQA